MLTSFSCFDTQNVTSLRGVRVFDVGQGDCLGVLDDHNAVVLYVDYGGLVDHPDKANPHYTATRLNVQSPAGLIPIVLTHWDKDHYFSAEKRNPAAQGSQWLVPTQRVSPQAAVFSAGLTRAYRWPETLGQRACRFRAGDGFVVEIRKCAPFDKNKASENRNHTGLSVALVRLDDDGKDMSFMLLPGDCAFDRIPSLPNAPLKAIAAYHHGARHDWSWPQTEEAIDYYTCARSIAYSYGANSYGHPDKTNYDLHWSSKASGTVQVIDTQSLRGKREYEDMTW